ncbi:MAG: RibD family protein [Desulfobacterales bacterium]|jgi:riboflavin-specific deaminase-like protein|nr:RibD family protein [Desulfobacterales bacterium]
MTNIPADRPGAICSLEELERRLAAAPAFRAAHRRPFIVLSYAQSVDGSIAGRNRERIQLSSPESMRITHGIRSLCGAILVGIGTVLADDPRLTACDGAGRQPQPVVLDTHLRTPPAARLVQRPDARPWLIHRHPLPDARTRALRAAGATPMACAAGPDGRIDLAALMGLLCANRVDSLMVEGGARVITSFLRCRLADLLVVTVSPRFVGGLAVLDAGQFEGGLGIHLEEAVYRQAGPDLIVWARPEWGPR